MAKARDTATDSLANVIEVVELGRRTGLLSVERGVGPLTQEGEIYFVSGRAIYATASYLRGREALAVLGQWGGCRFAFDAGAPAPIANIMPTASMPVPTPGPAARGAETPAWLPASGPAAPSGRWRTPPPGPGDSSYGTSAPSWASAPGAPAPTNGAANGAWRNGQSTPGAASGAWGASPPANGAASGAWGNGQSAPGAASGPLGRRPRRAPDVRDLIDVVSTYQLSRGHRAILLLADGSHNVLDLARLASKTIDEVTQLLAELEVRGLIYY